MRSKAYVRNVFARYVGNRRRRALVSQFHNPTSNGDSRVPKGATFDSAYFRKYYFSAATRVTTSAEMRGRARLIAAILRHAGIPVRSILDAGCGIGLMRKPSAEALPRARYTGLETSDYLCT